MTPAVSFAALLERFFTQRLMHQRHASPHTISSYRDTFRQFLTFTQQRLQKAPSRLTFEEIHAPLIYLEATMAMKENALAKTNPHHGRAARYHPGDRWPRTDSGSRVHADESRGCARKGSLNSLPPWRRQSTQQ
jgi:hypothetical protein